MLPLEIGGSGDNGPYRAILWLLIATNDVAIGITFVCRG